MKDINSVKTNFILIWEKYKVHFLVWLIFILYESVISGLVSGVFGKFSNYAIHYSINVFLFYINAHLVLPVALKKKEQIFFRLPLLLILLIIGYVFFVFTIDTLLLWYTNILDITNLSFDRAFVLRAIWRSAYFIIFSTGYYFLITYLKEKSRVSDLEKERLTSIIEQEKTQSELFRTQNAFLKAQINPHFLFNTLSFMHSQTQKIAPKVAETILSLSDMMRYALKNESLDEEAILTEEIEQVENLIKLHQLRSDKPLQIKIVLKGDLTEIQIIPLVLITLAENMFKHGNLHEPHSPALILIELQNEDLLVRTENLINPQKSATSFNLGLQNIKKRLEIKYQSQHSFTYYTDERNYFHTRIWIENICLS